MTTQFFHDMENGQTYAVDVSFNREDLLETVHHFDQPIAFKIGKSYVHPNDNYCKKTGREISAGKMKPVMLHYENCHKEFDEDGNLRSDRLYLVFNDPVASTVYLFRVNNKSDKPHFLGVRQD